MNDIPKARDLYDGDVNKAVIAVQNQTGVKITPGWWDEKVGNGGTVEEILERFDKAYAELAAQQ
jgi:hypothetical protein